MFFGIVTSTEGLRIDLVDLVDLDELGEPNLGADHHRGEGADAA